MTVINLIGGPAVGKSTLAHELTAAMSKKGYSVEYISEYAKVLTWKDRVNTLEGHQPYIFEKQADMYFYLDKKVDFVITDSPLILSSFYATKFDNLPKGWFDYVLWKVNKYNNLNYLIHRNHNYSEEGRNQTEDEASVMSDEISLYLDSQGVVYKNLLSTNDNVTKILEAVG